MLAVWRFLSKFLLSLSLVQYTNIVLGVLMYMLYSYLNAEMWYQFTEEYSVLEIRENGYIHRKILHQDIVILEVVV